MTRVLVVALLVVLTGCSASVAGAPSRSTAAPVAATTTTPDRSDADRKVCIDLDARGETAYNDFVVPMMTGAPNVEVDIQRWTAAITSMEQIGAGEIDQATPAISEAASRLVASAEAFTVQDNANGTALLTAFVTLAVECQKAGYKPSWFDAQALRR